MPDAMADSVTIDTTSLNRWIMRFHDDLGVSVNKLLRYEMRLCLRDCISWTGPKSLADGREKVRKDFSRSSKPLNSNALTGAITRTARHHKEVLSSMEEEMLFTFYLLRANDMIRNRDYAGMNAMLQKMGKGLSKYHVAPFSPALFTAAPRGPNGGVKSQKVFVFDSAQWKRQLAEVQSHVGRLKAGWLPAYHANGGGAVASWIERHANGARGSYTPPDMKSDRQFAIATNFALGVGRSRAVVQRALKAREGAARKDFFMFFNGRKDISQIT